jgi:hypothetical protein
MRYPNRIARCAASGLADRHRRDHGGNAGGSHGRGPRAARSRFDREASGVAAGSGGGEAERVVQAGLFSSQHALVRVSRRVDRGGAGGCGLGRRAQRVPSTFRSSATGSAVETWNSPLCLVIAS